MMFLAQAVYEDEHLELNEKFNTYELAKQAIKEYIDKEIPAWADLEDYHIYIYQINEMATECYKLEKTGIELKEI